MKENNLQEMLYALGENGEESRIEIYNKIQNKKKQKSLKWKTGIGMVALVFLLSTTGFADSIISEIKMVILPSGSKIIQDEERPKILDKVGNYVQRQSQEERELKDKNDPKTVGISADEIQEILTFVPKLPDANQVTSVAHYNTIDTEPVNAFHFYMNTPYGKAFVQERESIPENQIESGSEHEIIEKTIDGVKVVLQGYTLETEVDGVLIFISMDTMEEDALIHAYEMLK
ncbi:MAG: hypothetical protein Q4Q07_08015 [Tissierellia bacterium]|nr:hypothetical protein [Tissierellia bacterium]